MAWLDQAGLARAWAKGVRTILRSAIAPKATAPFVGNTALVGKGDPAAPGQQRPDDQRCQDDPLYGGCLLMVGMFEVYRSTTTLSNVKY